VGRARIISEIYTEHNRRRGEEFVYGGAERVEELGRLLGSRRGAVLDLGCRDGALAAALGLDPTTGVGIDIDLEALKRAASSGRLRVVASDLWASLPVQSGSFNVVLAGEILEHVPFPEVLVAEAARVLRSDGILVGSTPNAFRLKNRLQFAFGRNFERDPTHLRQFSPASLRALLGSHFQEVLVRPCVGRWVWVSPRLAANDLVFAARKPLPRDATNP
jgi:2-polyprenyl-3-methyl-5-hydroxy-6-metoxy-1,4-benzoquinol methylase